MGRIILVALIPFFACNSTPEANTEIVAKEDTVTELRYVAKAPIGLAGCYSWTMAGDTAILQMSIRDTRVSGNLVYDWAEKDRNEGRLDGVLQDSLVVASYAFQSEGTTSVREVVFKIKGDSLLEGYGAINTSGDTIKYKSKARLQFPLDRPFVKGACKE